MRPYTASLLEVNRKSRARMAGKAFDPLATGALMASRFFSRFTGLSLNRKLFTGWTILPFSISQTPSRVRPVITRFCGLTERMYQNRVTSRARSVSAIRSSSELVRAFQDHAAGERDGLPAGLAGPVAVDGQLLHDAVLDPGGLAGRQPMSVADDATPPPPRAPGCAG